MIKDNIQVLLAKQHKTVKAMREFAEISDSGLRHFYKRDSCDLAILRKIAQFFEVSVGELIGETLRYATVNNTNNSLCNVGGEHNTINATGEYYLLLTEKIEMLESMVKQKDKQIALLEKTIEDKNRIIQLLSNGGGDVE